MYIIILFVIVSLLKLADTAQTVGTQSDIVRTSHVRKHKHHHSKFPTNKQKPSTGKLFVPYSSSVPYSYHPVQTDNANTKITTLPRSPSHPPFLVSIRLQSS